MREYTYGVGFGVACSDAKAMREPQIAEQQDCSPAFCLYISINQYKTEYAENPMKSRRK